MLTNVADMNTTNELSFQTCNGILMGEPVIGRTSKGVKVSVSKRERARVGKKVSSSSTIQLGVTFS